MAPYWNVSSAAGLAVVVIIGALAPRGGSGQAGGQTKERGHGNARQPGKSEPTGPKDGVHKVLRGFENGLVRPHPGPLPQEREGDAGRCVIMEYCRRFSGG